MQVQEGHAALNIGEKIAHRVSGLGDDIALPIGSGLECFTLNRRHGLLVEHGNQTGLRPNNEIVVELVLVAYLAANRCRCAVAIISAGIVIGNPHITLEKIDPGHCANIRACPIVGRGLD